MVFPPKWRTRSRKRLLLTLSNALSNARPECSQHQTHKAPGAGCSAEQHDNVSFDVDKRTLNVILAPCQPMELTFNADATLMGNTTWN